jgi:FAD binding domain-containing protein/berberine-like enzyme
MTGVPGTIEGLKGQALREENPGYEAARHVFNGLIDRPPAVIVRPVHAADVAVALAYSREHGLPVAIRGGGHNVAGNAVIDGGLVIDNSHLRAVSVAPAGQTADVEPGATWVDFDRATQVHGLAATGGLISSTGVAGFTLGGGIGWLLRKLGLACDNLIEADVVTADGRMLRAASNGDPDLLWALRGGGGNFGVVTRLRFQLHPLRDVTGGLLGYPRARAIDVLRHWRDFVRDAPPDLTTIAALMTTPDGHPAVGIALCHAGSPADAAADVRTLRSFGPPAADHVETMPYTPLQTSLDSTAPHGVRNYWKSDFVAELTDDAIEVLVRGANRISSSLSMVHIHHLGGAMSREPQGGSAFAHRGSAFVYNLIATWTEPGEDPVHIGWARTLFDELRPHSLGAAYLNFLGDDGDDRAAAAYGSSLNRLSELKRRHDPQNIFRANQNIDPTRVDPLASSS